MEGTATVADVMTRDFLGVSEGDTAAGVAALLVETDADCAVVVRGEEAVGLLSGRDLLGAVADGADLSETTAGTLMTDPEPTVPADGPLSEASAAMAAAGRRVVVATEDGTPAGVVTAHDVATTPAALGPPTTPGGGSAGDGPAGGTDPAVADPTAAATGADPRSTAGDAPDPESYSTQSVCERCGALSGDLRNFNGQLVCADCRET